MAKEKVSKLSTLMQGNASNLEEKNQSNKRGVFQSNMFNANTARVEDNNATNDYKYTTLSIEDLIYNSPEDSPTHAFYASVAERIVSPVIVAYDFVEKEKAGRKYREKTGKYTVIDGNSRISIYHSLYKEALEKNDAEAIKKYNHVPAILLPLDTKVEEIEKVQQMANEHKMEGVQNVMKDITETQKEDITYCYRYEMTEIPLEKLVERENKYRILPSEVNELEQSIFKAGLMQPIIVLPIIDPRTLDVQYEIQAGHKRKRAICQLVQHAKDGWYPTAKDVILETFKTVPALIIPMGASPEQVEKIYNDTNLLSRHMTSEDVFQHISYFPEMPSRPVTKEEYTHFKDSGYQIQDLAKILQNKFKAIGFQDWKATKAKTFLNIYYYGSDLALQVLENPKEYNLTQKELAWVVTNNKDFIDRKKQDEIINQAKEDKKYLLELIEASKRVKMPSKTSYKDMQIALQKQKQMIERLNMTEVDTTKKISKDEKAETIATIAAIEETLNILKSKLEEM